MIIAFDRRITDPCFVALVKISWIESKEGWCVFDCCRDLLNIKDILKEKEGNEMKYIFFE